LEKNGLYDLEKKGLICPGCKQPIGLFNEITVKHVQGFIWHPKCKELYDNIQNRIEQIEHVDDVDCIMYDLMNIIRPYLDKDRQTSVLRCFMGDCVHLDPNDNDPCKDYEARSGKWGKCKEFKPKEQETPDSQLRVTINPMGVMNASKIILPKIIEDGLKEMDKEKEASSSETSMRTL